MRFAHPYLLLLLGFPPGSRLVEAASAARTPPSSIRRSNSSNRSRTSNNRGPGAILLTLRWLVLALCVVALAQPRLVTGETRVKSSGIDIAVAMDLSGSMESEDFVVKNRRVNRITMAKDALLKFVAKRPNDRIGLIVFATEAFTASPMTLDHDYLIRPSTGCKSAPLTAAGPRLARP